MSNNLEKLLDYLEVAEGKEVHYNDGELDITLPYGLYLKTESEMYQYIVDLGEQQGIYKPTALWNDEDIEKVNILVRKTGGLRELARRFYKEEMRGAYLGLFPVECVAVMESMYTNSPKYAWKSVQLAIIQAIENGRVDLSIDEVSKVDGVFGRKTRDALTHIQRYNKNKDFTLYFETLMLSNMTDNYIELWASNPKKYSKYLAGWKNRMAHFKMLK